MSDFEENLFVVAGCSTAAASDDQDAGANEPLAHQADASEPATPPHPAQHLQDAYLETMSRYAKLQQDIESAAAVAETIAYCCDIRHNKISFESMSKCAVTKTVHVFAETLRERAELDADEEFSRAFGKPMHELIDEGHGDDWERARYQREDFRFRKARREGTQSEQEREDEHMPPPYVVDLLKLWDSLAAAYSDGGLTLARRQAASTILREWQLDRQQFEVKNGKATIVDRVWSEKHDYGHRRGTRTVGYSYTSGVYNLFAALEVFLSFADETYLYPLQQMRDGHDIVVRSGAKYGVCPSMEVRTFNEEWKYTMSATLAEKLREFIGTYGAAE